MQQLYAPEIRKGMYISRCSANDLSICGEAQSQRAGQVGRIRLDWEPVGSIGDVAINQEPGKNFVATGNKKGVTTGLISRRLLRYRGDYRRYQNRAVQNLIRKSQRADRTGSL
jgi:hypothetical protein